MYNENCKCTMKIAYGIEENFYELNQTDHITSHVRLHVATS